MFYDIAIGADVAASAGVGLGIVGVGGSAGGGVEVVWRYDTVHEVARAIRSMVILQAVGPRLEAASLALNSKLGEIDRAIDAARRTADRLRSALRSWMPWRNNALVRWYQRRQDEMRAQRRQLVDGARGVLEGLISWVATERIYLIHHQHGYEVHAATAMDVGVGVKLDENVKLEMGAEIKREFAMHAEFGFETEGISYEHKLVLTGEITGGIGAGVGLSGGAKRVIELSQKLDVDAGGLETARSATSVKLTLDRALGMALGATVTGKVGVGREISLEVGLEELVAYGADAIAVLMGDDTQKAADLLSALPTVFTVRGRYEAGLKVGVDVKVRGVGKLELGASAKYTDWSTVFEYDHGSIDFPIMDLVRDGNLPSDTLATATLHKVYDEVARVMR